MSLQQRITALAQAVGADIKQLQAQTAPALYLRTEVITATSSGQTSFTVPGGYTPGAILVSLNGAALAPADYSATNGSTVVLTSGAGIVSGSSVLLVYAFSAFEVADALPLGGTAADATRFGGQLPEHYATQADLPGAEYYQRNNVVGVVAQLGGVPTGALVEYGSNANGEYWRYAGGMQVCRKFISDTAITVSTSTYTILRTSTDNSLPIAFADAPIVLPQYSGGYAGEIVATVESTTPLEFFRILFLSKLSGPARTVNPLVGLVAIGRWY